MAYVCVQLCVCSCARQKPCPCVGVRLIPRMTPHPPLLYVATSRAGEGSDPSVFWAPFWAECISTPTPCPSPWLHPGC